MRINYNASAMRAHNALNVADSKVSASLQRLSSGLKVNQAKDNPSGYAIGRRMNAQVKGVSVATQNASTSISIIETADGALTEVHEMLQRMNELCIKSATGTMTTSDRAIVQEEVKQLKAEVARIAKDTEFNGQTLLDGSFDLKGYTNNLDVKVGYYSDEALDKVYTIDALEVFYEDAEKGKIDLARTQASFTAGDGFPAGAKITSVGENCITITDDKGFEVTLDVAQPPEGTTSYSPIPSVYATDARVNVVGFNANQIPQNHVIDQLSITYDAAGGIDTITAVGSNTNLTVQGFNATDTPDGHHITVTCDNGIQLEMDITRGPVNPAGGYDPVNINNLGVNVEGLKFDLTGIGAMDTQIGANEGQILEVRIPTVSLQRLGITNADVSTQESSADAIVAVKGAIAYVSSARSRLGAYQNRLEHTVSSLDITSENMTSAYSRIMDADVSEEMTEYTTNQVVEQAAVSMLAQANERPSQVLQLLQ